MNNELFKFQARIIGFQLLFLAIVGLLIALFVGHPKAYIQGLVFGGVIGALSFRIMGISMEKSVKLNPSAAQINAGIGYAIRLLIYGATLYVAAKADYLSMLTTALGLVAIKIVIISLNFFKIKL